MHIDFAIQLHEEMRVTYVVDGYVAELLTHDGEITSASAHGDTVALAIAHLQDKLDGIEDLTALRAIKK